MGKAGKRSRSEKRKMQKKAKKAAKAALYHSYAEQGRSNKRARGTLSTGKGNHTTACCGNVGCRKCFPRGG